jgi:hypothetical protein
LEVTTKPEERQMTSDEFEARLHAHRLTIVALALVLERSNSGAYEGLIATLSEFESSARKLNEEDHVVHELREVQHYLSDFRGKRDHPESFEGQP